MEYFSYGEYFLYGGYDGAPVYQHFAGVEYLYRKDGNWLISDEIGLREAGLQNQVRMLSNRTMTPMILNCDKVRLTGYRILG